MNCDLTIDNCDTSPAVMLCLHSSSSSPPPSPPTLRLLCSSNICPRPVLLHSDCYDKLENLLVQAVSSSKNFKNWTEYQVSFYLLRDILSPGARSLVES